MSTFVGGKNQRFSNIQYLRVIACMGVMIAHLGQRVPNTSRLAEVFRTVTDFGGNGVYLFFVISGFLGMVSYEKEPKCIKYWIKRALRILPLYYFVIILDCFLFEVVLKESYVIPQDEWGIGWIRYFFMISKVIPTKTVFWSNLSSTWSISYFMLFYLLVPLLYKFIRTFWHSVVWLGITICLAHFWSKDWFTPVIGLFFFSLGVCIYYAGKESKERILCSGVITYAIVLIVFDRIGSSLYALLFTILIIESKNFQIQNEFLTKVVDKLDKYSYTIYLWHAVVLEQLGIWKGITLPIQGLIFLIAMILGCPLINYLIEQPIYTWGKSLYNRHDFKEKRTYKD